MMKRNYKSEKDIGNGESNVSTKSLQEEHQKNGDIKRAKRLN